MSDWAAELRNMREMMKQYVDSQIVRIFGFTLTGASSAIGDSDSVQTGDGEDSQKSARRIEPWGHRGVAPKNMRSLTLRLGASNFFFIGIASDGGYGPKDLDVGETALYSSADGAVVKLDKDGNISVTAGAGKKVKIVADASGAVELGPDGGPNAQVLVLGSIDSMGVPVTQFPANSASTVKAG